MRWHRAASLVVLALTVTGCAGGTDDVPREQVERQVMEQLKGEGYAKVDSVACDDDLPAQEKAAVECTVGVVSKDPVRVRLTVTDVTDAGEVRYDIEDADAAGTSG